MKADIVLLAIGFQGGRSGIVSQFGSDIIDQSARQEKDNIYGTGRPGVFVAGDAIMGASLVARAIRSGREAAAQIDSYLKNK